MFDGETVVDEAAGWAEALLQRSYRGPGDTIEAATYRAERKYGVPAQTFWALRYRQWDGKNRTSGDRAHKRMKRRRASGRHAA